MIQEKQCKGCAKVLPVDRYSPSGNVKDGYENKCRECRNASRKKKHTYSCKECGKTFSKIVAQDYCSNVCSGKSRRMNPAKFEEYVSSLGGEYSLIGNFVTTRKKVSIRHNTCGNIFRPTPNNFTEKGSRCPSCTVSKGEELIRDWLVTEEIDFQSQARFAECKDKSTLPFDFAVYDNGTLKCLIEYDGEQHYKPIEAWGGVREFRNVQRRDRIKDTYCASRNITLVRIPYTHKNRISSILSKHI